MGNSRRLLENPKKKRSIFPETLGLAQWRHSSADYDDSFETNKGQRVTLRRETRSFRPLRVIIRREIIGRRVTREKKEEFEKLKRNWI